jgi:nifR3 family TIM-barrel protein
VVLRIGSIPVDPPVVLAPMAGVTDAPFRGLCRSFGAGLYVSEMVLAAALLHRNPKTEAMVTFPEGEWPRSVQLYGSDPAVMGEAVRRLVGDGRVDHVDLNFGCPAPKVTRHGGGAAVPVRPRLLGAIVASAVDAASPGGVPVTMKMRVGLRADVVTHIDAGRAAQDAGAAAVALHARTAEQRYAGAADWTAIAELKEAVTSIPVLGNGDIWEAGDALAMMATTGCDGVVVGRGCLGRPWLFADLADAFAGRPVASPRELGTVVDVLADHGRLLAERYGEPHGLRQLRKHTGWYLTGYPVGPEVRRRLALVSTLDELSELLMPLDRSIRLPDGAHRLPRGHTDGPRRVVLPDGYLDDRDAAAAWDPAADALVSGG